LGKILKRNDIAPEWVESNKRLFGDMKEMRKLLKEGYIKYQLKPQQAEPVTETPSQGFLSSIIEWLFPKPKTSQHFEGEQYERKYINGIWVTKRKLSGWEFVQEDTAERIKKINKEVALYNSMVPYFFQVFPLEMENEMKEMMLEVASEQKISTKNPNEEKETKFVL